MKRFLFFSVFIAMAVMSFAQDPSKYSISTQMFLDELNGKISFDHPVDFVRGIKANGINTQDVLRYSKYDRPIAKAVEKDGVKVISAFIRVTDRSVVSELEALGVEIECEFLNGTLFTALIPVDKIGEVSELAKVSHINVATKKRPLTNMARQGTNVDDVLTYSNDARLAGLTSDYDGSGVLLGVIDTGIDFQHKAFKDKDGNFRIKRAYCVIATENSSGNVTYNAKEYGDGLSNALTSSAPTTDDSSEDHGTHTSTTAGGSSVIINGSTTTVTDNHASATYGGMAPGADLYLAGCDLSDTYLANSFNKIVNYADSKGMPVVVSNSWGSQMGPHDGTGDFADICADYFSDNNPNHICLFAASNDAGTNGFHVSGTASSSSPLGTVMNWNTEYGLTYYYGILANGWTRSTGVTLNCKVIVINSSGQKQTEVTVNPTSGGNYTNVTENINSYVSSGYLLAYRDYLSSNKSQVMLYASSLKMRSGYKLAVQFYPANGSSVVDVWSGSAYTYFTSTPSTSNYTWTAGSDNMCVSDEATIPNAISIGAYSTKNQVTDYNGRSHTLSDFTVGDIAYFSSWASASASPTGLQYPWICAPGATVVSGVNAYDTSGSMSYISGGSANYDMYRVNTDTTNPYGSMEGTSMATPCAAGIVALWLQVAKENDLELTTSDIKTIMKESAITDSYTNGTNASHFGNGKIDALAGIKYILDNYVQNDSPRITATPTSIDFGNVTAGTSTTQTFTVTGENLEGNIALAKSGNNFSIDKTSITKNNDGTASATVTVTFAPTANVTNTYTGSVTLTSSNATTVTVSLTGKGVYTAPVIAANPTSLSFTGDSGQTYTKTVTVTGSNLQGNITAAIQNDANGFYSVSPTSFNAASQTVTVTWHPTAGGTSTANLVLTTTGTGANTVTVPLTGTAQGPAITANPTSLAFGTVNVGENATKTFTVTGARLEGNITLAKSGDRFSIDKTSIAKNSDGTASATVTVTYTPTADGNDTGTVTLTSSGAEAVTVNLTGAGHVLNPTINVSKDALTFATYINEPVTQTFTVTGVDLDKTVYLAVQNDADGVFSLSQASVTANLANGSGREITVTFTPTTLGDYSATVRLSSTGAETKYVTLSGSALEHVPALTTSTQNINFGTVGTSEQASQTFTLNGEYLLGDVTLTLNDANGVFTLSDATVTKADAEAGKTVTVGFSATDETAYSGSITVSTNGLQDITIALSAEVSNGGTASDAYLNIAKYATIDEAGWNTNYVNNLYKYTEYPSDGVAWLTLPVYGAWTGYRYENNAGPQKWIESNITTTTNASTVYYETSWNANDIHLGSSQYFTNTTARAFGTSSTYAYTARTITFYVTNTNAVKLYGKNNNSNISSYPTRLQVYVCQENNDGTLTASTTATKDLNNTTSNETFNMVADDLDETQIYKVVATWYRAQLYEIGFQTPMNIPTLKVNPDELTFTAAPGESVTATFNVKGRMLEGDVNVSLTSANGAFTVLPTSISKSAAEAGTDVTVTFNAPATEGTYTGAVTLTSGSLTQSVNLSGTSQDVPVYIYVLTTTLTAGKEYLVVSGNSAGSAYALGHNNATVAADAVTIKSDTSVADAVYIESDVVDETSVWTAGASSTLWTLKNGDYYATVSGSGGNRSLTMATSSTNNWTLGTNQLYYKGTRNSYYLRYYNNTFSVNSSANNIYLYEKTQVIRKPSLAVSPAYLEYTIEPGATETKSFTVTGRLLTEDVTLTLTDENGVYTLGTTTISAADAMAGATVSVTLNAPETMGSYRGVVNLTSGEATAREVLYGTVGDKGSAYSNYLNIAKYATIATTNWYESIFANAYKFTPDEANEVAWLTVPAALPYYAWNYNDQNWCGVSSSASGGWYGHQWTATDVFQGYEYFQGEFEDETDTYAHMMGGAESNSTSNTTIFYGIYNVTNCSQVKAYVYNNGATSSYPAFIQIYELTENADGTLTQSETRTDIQTSYTSGAQTMTSAELDPDKIYLVAVGGYRGFTYEVAFRTPFVTKEGTLAQMVADNSLAPGYNYRYTDGNVLAVYLSQDRKTLFCKDDNAYASKVFKAADQTDYLYEMTKERTIDLLRSDYDQSNWVALTMSDGSEFSDKTYVGSWLNGVTGTIVDLDNPQLQLSAKPSLGTAATTPYLSESNVFIPSNFNGTNSQEASGYNFFFMTPKPMEVVNVTWALWNEADNCFTEIPTMANSEHGGAIMNPYGLTGSFVINPKFITAPTLTDGTAYKFVAVVGQNAHGTVAALSHRSVKSNGSSGAYTVYPLSDLTSIGTAGGTVTGIFNVNADGREVKEVRYIDVTGRVSKTPWRGVNIVDTIYNDGSHSTKKVRF